MNWHQFKDPTSRTCFAGVVYHPGLLHKKWQVQDILMTDIFVTELAEFLEKKLGKTPLLSVFNVLSPHLIHKDLA